MSVDKGGQKKAPKRFNYARAEDGTRTRDLRITNALLYQLSYFGERDHKSNTFFLIGED